MGVEKEMGGGKVGREVNTYGLIQMEVDTRNVVEDGGVVGR